jgi:XTP/dITP diphosphohydrolase
MIIVLGTRNRKKRDELLDLLRIPGLKLVTLDEVPVAWPEVHEDADDFLGNAVKKASQTAKALRQWVLGEDSGLCVDALSGAPGVFSARFAGEPCDDERNNDKLLADLADVPDEKRAAHYVCVMALSDPQGNIHATAEGRCHGSIARFRRGTGGFGYDPLFIAGDTQRTFGELPAEFKQRHSHRASAASEMRSKIISLMSELQAPLPSRE